MIAKYTIELYCVRDKKISLKQNLKRVCIFVKPMKIKFLFIFGFLFSMLVNAQIDSQIKSTPIPAIESKKDSAVTSIPFPSKTNQNNSFSGLSIPKTNSELNVPKKEFSMFGETFGNPGELYEKRLEKNIKSINEEIFLGTKGSKVDVYFGDFKTKSKYVYVFYSDYGQQDGDLISISVNDEIIKPRVYLTNATKGFKLDLKEGFNKIDFLALNEGSYLPNTAEFRIVDEQENVIASNLWALSINVKGTVIIVKE